MSASTPAERDKTMQEYVAGHLDHPGDLRGNDFIDVMVKLGYLTPKSEAEIWQCRNDARTKDGAQCECYFNNADDGDPCYQVVDLHTKEGDA